jgi:hypothetical protein
VAEWQYFINPPRDGFAATMVEEERAVSAVHVIAGGYATGELRPFRVSLPRGRDGRE